MYKIYEVKVGDTVDSIANRFKTTKEDLKKINGFPNDYQIMVGEYIVVPVMSQVLFDTYIVKKGDTMYEISRRFNVNVEDLLKLNGLSKDDYIYPNQEILVPAEGINFIITNEGDTTSLISSKLGIGIAELLLENENLMLAPDQVIVYKK